MITIPQHHVFQITFVPLVPIEVVVEFRLLLLPHVKGFVHHNEAHPVGQLEQFGSGRIV